VAGMTTTGVTRPWRVLLVDDDALVRAGLRMILSAAPDLEVVGEVADGRAAVAAVQGHQPDVVLMDIRMPDVDGITATSLVRQLPDPPQVIVLTTFHVDEYVFGALRAGASGFLLKDTPPAEITNAVRLVAGGDRNAVPERHPHADRPVRRSAHGGTQVRCGQRDRPPDQAGA